MQPPRASATKGNPAHPLEAPTGTWGRCYLRAMHRLPLLLSLAACASPTPAPLAGGGDGVGGGSDSAIPEDTDATPLDTAEPVDTADPEDTGTVVLTDLDADGWSEADGDCDDDDAAVYPGAEDPRGDGVDSDCDGEDGVFPDTPPPDGILVCSVEELDAAVEAALPGDDILMCDGSWTDVSIEFEVFGTAEEPIILWAETPGKVIITGHSRLYIGGTYAWVSGLVLSEGYGKQYEYPIDFRPYSSATSDYDCPGCRLVNSAVLGWNAEAIDIRYAWVLLRGQDIRVDHNLFAGKKHNGPVLQTYRPDPVPEYHRVDHNYFGSFEYCGFNGCETVMLGDSVWPDTDAFTSLDHNYFQHADGEYEIITNKASSNTLSYNTFDQCYGLLSLRVGGGNTVEGNLFLVDQLEWAGGVRITGPNNLVINNYVRGVPAMGSSSSAQWRGAFVISNGDGLSDSYPDSTGNVIAYNTVVDSEPAFVIGAGGYPNPVTGTRIVGNVVGRTDGMEASQIVWVVDPAAETAWADNLFSGGALGIDPVDGIEEIDPLLALDADGIARPGPGSPALDAITAPDPEVALDIDAGARTIPYDAGADEVGATGGETAPLIREEVGPRSFDAFGMMEAVLGG